MTGRRIWRLQRNAIPQGPDIELLLPADGTLLAMDIEFVIDGGAYATLSGVVLSRGTIHAAGPYRCPNVRVRSKALATNSPPHGAFRGFGAPQSIFALERHMDQVAKAIGLPPDEFRSRNFLRAGETTATGQTVKQSLDMPGLQKRALTLADYWQKKSSLKPATCSVQRRKVLGLRVSSMVRVLRDRVSAIYSRWWNLNPLLAKVCGFSVL